MTPAEYLEEIVFPAVVEFQDERQSRRRAYSACVFVFHLTDHLGEAGHAEVCDVMRRSAVVFSGVSAYDIVRDVCNGVKHSVLTRNHEIGFSAGDDRERPAAVWGKAVWGLSKWDDSHGGREVEVGGGFVDLFDVVVTTLKTYLEKFEDDLGGVPTPPSLPLAQP